MRAAMGARTGRFDNSALITAHARTRMQQRGIRARALEALLDHGRVARAPGGAEIVVLKKTYAILGANGAVLTVGHRRRRLPRP